MGERFEAIIDIRGLSLEFPTYSGPVKALSDISLEVFNGEIVGLVGEERGQVHLESIQDALQNGDRGVQLAGFDQ